MTDEQKTENADESDPKSTKEKVGDGIKQGLGFLSAFRDALEETIQEARERGDLSSDKAKEVMKDALDRAQSAAGDAKDRLDFAKQADLDGMRAAFESIKVRVSELEQSVFGASKDAGTSSEPGDSEAEDTSEPKG